MARDIFELMYRKDPKGPQILMTERGPQYFSAEYSDTQKMTPEEYFNESANTLRQEADVIPKLAFNKEQKKKSLLDALETFKAREKSYQSEQAPIFGSNPITEELAQNIPRTTPESKLQQQQGFFGVSDNPNVLRKNMLQLEAMKKSSSPFVKATAQNMLAAWWEQLTPEEKKSVKNSMLEDIATSTEIQQAGGGI